MRIQVYFFFAVVVLCMNTLICWEIHVEIRIKKEIEAPGK